MWIVLFGLDGKGCVVMHHGRRPSVVRRREPRLRRWRCEGGDVAVIEWMDVRNFWARIVWKVPVGVCFGTLLCLQDSTEMPPELLDKGAFCRVPFVGGGLGFQWFE